LLCWWSSHSVIDSSEVTEGVINSFNKMDGMKAELNTVHRMFD
jgi:hypothetical protein